MAERESDKHDIRAYQFMSEQMWAYEVEGEPGGCLSLEQLIRATAKPEEAKEKLDELMEALAAEFRAAARPTRLLDAAQALLLVVCHLRSVHADDEIREIVSALAEYKQEGKGGA